MPKILDIDAAAEFLYNVYSKNCLGIKLNALRGLAFLFEANEIHQCNILEQLCIVALQAINERTNSQIYHGMIISEKLARILSEERAFYRSEHEKNPQMSDEEYNKKESEDKLAQFFSSFPFTIVCKGIEDSEQVLNLVAIKLAVSIVVNWDPTKLFESGVIKSLIVSKEMSFPIKNAAVLALSVILQHHPSTIDEMIENEFTPDDLVDNLQSSIAPCEILKALLAICSYSPEIAEQIADNGLISDIS